MTITHPEFDELAQQLAETTGERVEDAVLIAVRDRLDRERKRRDEVERQVEAVMEIARRVSQLPVLDPRSPDELLGYDEHGLPT